MAEDEVDLDPSEGPPQKKNTPPWVWLIIAALVIGVLVLRSCGSDGEDDEAAEAEAEAETEAEAEGDAEGESADFGALEIEGPSGDRAVEELVRNLSEKEEELEELRERQAQMETFVQERFEAQEQMVDERMNQITQAIEGLREDEIRDDFAGDQREPEDPDIPQLPDLDATTDPAIPDDPLADEADAGARTDTRSGFAYESLYDGGREPVDSDDFDGLEVSDATPDNDEEEEPEPEPEPEREDITISPSSHVEVVNLYGLECPVGRSLGGGGQAGGDLTNSTPALLQIRGHFQGPNNEIVDVGEAHLIGFCEGMRTGESARIRIEQISYVDERGETHVAPANGFIVDGRTNDMDVAGTLETDRTGDAVAASALDGLAAIGDLAERSQFDESTNTDGDQISAFTGDAGPAAGGALVGGTANRLAELYLSDLEANLDVIHVPAATPMIFNTLEPIVIEGGLPPGSGT